MQGALDLFVVICFVLFLTWLMRGFMLQVQSRQEEREKARKDKDKK